ncbi:hypothetical protein T492DRAFT_899321 [Pavlovales sp. CCMP2436]|nr:hypothetical protein T492DRAFT_899321 [Pavlovales sp. CCMP2436]
MYAAALVDESPPPWVEHLGTLQQIVELAIRAHVIERQRDPAAALTVLRVLRCYEQATAGRALPPSEDSRLYRAIVAMSLEPESDWRLKLVAYDRSRGELGPLPPPLPANALLPFVLERNAAQAVAVALAARPLAAKVGDEDLAARVGGASAPPWPAGAAAGRARAWAGGTESSVGISSGGRGKRQSAPAGVQFEAARGSPWITAGHTGDLPKSQMGTRAASPAPFGARAVGHSGGGGARASFPPSALGTAPPTAPPTPPLSARHATRRGGRRAQSGPRPPTRHFFEPRATLAPSHRSELGSAPGSDPWVAWAGSGVRRASAPPRPVREQRQAGWSGFELDASERRGSELGSDLTDRAGFGNGFKGSKAFANAFAGSNLRYSGGLGAGGLGASSCLVGGDGVGSGTGYAGAGDYEEEGRYGAEWAVAEPVQPLLRALLTYA